MTSSIHNKLIATLIALILIFTGLGISLITTDTAYAASKKITKISTKSKYQYTGKKITVKVKVYAGKTKVTSKNYKTTFYIKKNGRFIKTKTVKTVGTYKVTVKAKKSYTGTKSKTFKVVSKQSNKSNQATHIHKWVAQTKSVRYMTDADFAEGAKYGCSIVNGTDGWCGTIGRTTEQVNDHLEAHPECVLTWNEPIYGIRCQCGQIFADLSKGAEHVMAYGHSYSSCVTSTIKHPASTHNKTVVVGYKCSCGATKSA